MGKTIDGGTILARLLLEDKDFKSKIQKLTEKIKEQAEKIKTSFVNLGPKITAIGQKMAEMGEKFTFLGGAIFAPMILSMKSFADKNEQARAKVLELSKAIQAMPAGPSLEKKQAQAQLQYYLMVVQKTQAAASAQEKLTYAFKTLSNVIGDLLWKTLGPYIPQIQSVIQTAIVWIKANQETAGSIVKVVTAVGSIALVLGPTLAITGKLIAVFGAGISGLVSLLGLLFSPLVLTVAAFAGLYYLFKDKLDPVFKTHLESIGKIWKSWTDGTITTKQAIGELSASLLSLIVDTFTGIGEKITAKVNEWTNGGMDKLFDWLVAAWDKAKQGLSNGWDAIVEKFEWGWSKIKNIWNTLSRGLTTSATVGVGMPAYNYGSGINASGITGNINQSLNFSNPIGTTEFAQAIRGAVKNITNDQIELLARALS